MSKNKSLTMMSLVMMTIVSVDSIRNLPAGALFGASLIFYYILAACVFFIPAGLVSADLATRFEDKSGVYVWVRSVLGQRMGLLAIWLQWIENVVWYPAILSFASASIIYLFAPGLAKNPTYMGVSTLAVFWILTFLNAQGMNISARFSNVCAVLGLIFPMSGIILLGYVWYASGKPVQIDMNAWMPHLSSNTWVSLTSIMLSLCGIEVATVHAEDVEHPTKTFPKALLLSTFVIVLTLILGSLSIALVVPHQQLSLVSGIMQTVNHFLSAYHLKGLLFFFACMILLGVLGSVSNWIIAPTRGLYQAACDGYFPKFMKKTNQKNAPVGLLWFQGGIVTALCVGYMVYPSVSDVYWLLTAVAAELYMLMYVLMFFAHLWLHWKKSSLLDQDGLIQSRVGAICISALGIVGCVITLVVGLIEPDAIHIGSKLQFAMLVLVTVLIFTVPPLFAYQFYKRTPR